MLQVGANQDSMNYVSQQGNLQVITTRWTALEEELLLQQFM
jgi:hypothetical protein